MEVNGFGDRVTARADVKIGKIGVDDLNLNEAKEVLNYRALRLYKKLQEQGGNVIFGKGSIQNRVF